MISTLHGVPFGSDGVRLERLLPGPIERVWSYLTDSDKRATWLAAGKFELELGGRIELRFDNDALSPGAPAPDKYRDIECSFAGRVTRVEPPRVLAFTWGTGSDASEVTFELTPRAGEVLLVITHRQLTERGERVSVASGWDTHVGILADRLRGATPKAFWPTHTKLEQDYERKL
jgi:uncharacterized protein YndB with AHSA1/START domain